VADSGSELLDLGLENRFPILILSRHLLEALDEQRLLLF
jgi:hypothetical protein